LWLRGICAGDAAVLQQFRHAVCVGKDIATAREEEFGDGAVSHLLRLISSMLCGTWKWEDQKTGRGRVEVGKLIRAKIWIILTTAVPVNRVRVHEEALSHFEIRFL